MDTEEIKPATNYDPSKETLDIIEKTYDDIDEMVDIMQDSFSEFNGNGDGTDRTLKQFLDDAQKRANSYVMTREAQGKEEWQANVFTPTTRNKVKALIAGIAKAPPEISITAKNLKNQTSVARAEILKLLIESSFVEGDKNPEIEMFFAGWDTAIQGTYIELDDYIRIKDKVKKITDYDPATGEVKFEEVETYVQDEAVSIRIPLTSFYIWDPYTSNVQDQTKIAWIEYLDKDDAEYQFGNFANWKYVKDGSYHFNEEDSKTFFLKRWDERTKGYDMPYEIVRYYCKTSDTYRIIANGVMLLDAPLLWGKTKKRYPFSKTIYEPFANSMFFWGNSLVNILMAEQDVENALINSITDKTYRSLNRPMLIGRVNRDDFDLEDEWVDGDTKIYVSDVAQVTPMPIDSVNNAEISMLKIIQEGLVKDSSDSVQSGQGGSGSTAREIVIANERAEELKGLFYTMLKDLWLQKYRIRGINILMNYGKAKTLEIVDEEGNKVYEESYKSFRLPSSELSNGKPGALEVQVVKDQASLKRPYELDVEEEKARMAGEPVEIMQITSNFLDDYDYGVRIMTETLFQKSRALKMAEASEKILGVAKLFPEIFMANKQKFFEDYMQMYGDNPDKYDAEPAAPPAQPGMEGMPGAEVQAQDMAAMGMPSNTEVPQMGQLPQVA